jgi:hypothetical protein
LFVSVGSDTPSASDDIRLSDVIVSLPSDGIDGLVGLERAATTVMPATPIVLATSGNMSSGSVCVGLLAPPLTVLLMALSGLEAKHQLADCIMCDNLAAAVKRYPKLRAVLAPLADRATVVPADRLYEVAYAHVGPRKTSCDWCNASRLVLRPDAMRPLGGSPIVH